MNIIWGMFMRSALKTSLVVLMVGLTLAGCRSRPVDPNRISFQNYGRLVTPNGNVTVNQKLQLLQCRESFGSVRIVEPQDVSSWANIGLSAPTRILRVEVDRASKCFTVVDRGLGFSAAQLERELASSGQLQQGQNIGAGQMRAADYVLVPEIISQNDNASGSNSNLSGGGALKLLGKQTAIEASRSNISRSKTAEVVLHLMDVRTSEVLATVRSEASISNKAQQRDIAAARGNFHIEAGGGSYENTELGKAVSRAYSDAFKKLLLELDHPDKQLLDRRKHAPAMVNVAQPTVAPVQTTSYTPSTTTQVVATTVPATQVNVTNVNIDIQALVKKSGLSLRRPARLLSEPNLQSTTVVNLMPGMMLYPTGEYKVNMIRVEDELGNKGWVAGSAVN